jgi:hypothetical protein
MSKHSSGPITEAQDSLDLTNTLNVQGPTSLTAVIANDITASTISTDLLNSKILLASTLKSKSIETETLEAFRIEGDSIQLDSGHISSLTIENLRSEEIETSYLSLNTKPIHFAQNKTWLPLLPNGFEIISATGMYERFGPFVSIYFEITAFTKTTEILLPLIKNLPFTPVYPVSFKPNPTSQYGLNEGAISNSLSDFVLTFHPEGTQKGIYHLGDVIDEHTFDGRSIDFSTAVTESARNSPDKCYYENWVIRAPSKFSIAASFTYITNV